MGFHKTVKTAKQQDSENSETEDSSTFLSRHQEILRLIK